MNYVAWASVSVVDQVVLLVNAAILSTIFINIHIITFYLHSVYPSIIFEGANTFPLKLFIKDSFDSMTTLLALGPSH